MERPTCKKEMNYRVEFENNDGTTKFKYFEKERSAVRRAKKQNGVVQMNTGNGWIHLEKVFV